MIYTALIRNGFTMNEEGLRTYNFTASIEDDKGAVIFTSA
jgi:hypothetical protein